MENPVEFERHISDQTYARYEQNNETTIRHGAPIIVIIAKHELSLWIDDEARETSENRTQPIENSPLIIETICGRHLLFAFRSEYSKHARDLASIGKKVTRTASFIYHAQGIRSMFFS
jgi:hypothetical protein